ncbi:MAG: glycoside hydrolase domain-containing protein, partial [Micromonosporaceae bacterium]
MLIEPAPRHAAHVSVENKVSRQVTVIARRIHIKATFDAHPEQIGRILASADLPRPVQDPPAAQSVPWLPPRVTNYHGRGFDTCAAPSEAAMRAWRGDSPYRAVGIFLGGSDAACAQPNLTPLWLRHEAAQGWHFIPMYVGPQARFGELSKSPASQGAAAATDAVHQARRLGFGPLTPIYYDMEAYSARQSIRVLRFLSAWTTSLHALGYSSGVYSSSSSGIADLAHQYRAGRYAIPDVIYDALWNGHTNATDPVLG